VLERRSATGLEKGMEVWAKNTALEVARKAVHEGVELPLIAKLTGLTKKEVEKLAKEMNN
jgi:dihydroorotate dehydrogenase